MAKQKISVTIDEELLSKVDSLAAKSGENRSCAIERLCRQSVQMESGEGDMVEYLKLGGPHCEMRGLFTKKLPIHWDKNCQRYTELVLRCRAADYREWLESTGAEKRKD